MGGEGLLVAYVVEEGRAFEFYLGWVRGDCDVEFLGFCEWVGHWEGWVDWLGVDGRYEYQDDGYRCSFCWFFDELRFW